MSLKKTKKKHVAAPPRGVGRPAYPADRLRSKRILTVVTPQIAAAIETVRGEESWSSFVATAIEARLRKLGAL